MIASPRWVNSRTWAASACAARARERGRGRACCKPEPGPQGSRYSTAPLRSRLGPLSRASAVLHPGEGIDHLDRLCGDLLAQDVFEDRAVYLLDLHQRMG